MSADEEPSKGYLYAKVIPLSCDNAPIKSIDNPMIAHIECFSALMEYDYKFYLQLYEDDSLRALFENLTSATPSYEAKDATAGVISQKLTLERAMFGRFHFEITQAVRIREMAWSHQLDAAEQKVVRVQALQGLNYIIDLVLHWPGWSLKDKLLLGAREQIEAFSQREHEGTRSLSRRLTESQARYLDLPSMEMDFKIVDEITGIRLDYESAKLIAFNDKAVPPGYHLPVIYSWYMMLHVFHDSSFYTQLAFDSALRDLLTDMMSDDRVPIETESLNAAETMSAVLTLERAMIARLDYELLQVKRVLIFSRADSDLANSEKARICAEALQRIDDLHWLGSWHAFDEVSDKHSALVIASNDLEAIVDSLDCGKDAAIHSSPPSEDR